VFMPGALDHLDRLAARHPNLKLVLDHVGLRIHRKGPQAFDDLPAVCALAKHPNLAVKASGLPALSTARYPFRDVQPHGMADDLHRKAVILIFHGGLRGIHALITSHLAAASQASQEVDNAAQSA